MIITEMTPHCYKGINRVPRDLLERRIRKGTVLRFSSCLLCSSSPGISDGRAPRSYRIIKEGYNENYYGAGGFGFCVFQEKAAMCVSNKYNQPVSLALPLELH